MLERRHTLDRTERGRTDQTTGCKHVERASPFSHQMRRRLEPAPPAHAAGREEAHPVVAEIPARRVGGIPRLGVVGKHAREPGPAGLLESREEEREERLGDARVARVGEELAQALALRELADEGRERRLTGFDRPVHDEGRNPGSAGSS